LNELLLAHVLCISSFKTAVQTAWVFEKCRFANILYLAFLVLSGFFTVHVAFFIHDTLTSLSTTRGLARAQLTSSHSVTLLIVDSFLNWVLVQIYRIGLLFWEWFEVTAARGDLSKFRLFETANFTPQYGMQIP